MTATLVPGVRVVQAFPFVGRRLAIDPVRRLTPDAITDGGRVIERGGKTIEKTLKECPRSETIGTRTGTFSIQAHPFARQAASSIPIQRRSRRPSGLSSERGRRGAPASARGAGRGGGSPATTSALRAGR